MSKPDKKTARETQTINVFFEHNHYLPLLYGERDGHLKRLEGIWIPFFGLKKFLQKSGKFHQK